nr:PHD finger protein MALE MEIOCYTE DEATH 1 [Ipomoea batatas]
MASEVIERDAQELEAGKGRKIDREIVVQQNCKPSSSHERLQAALLCFISQLQSLSSFSVEQRTKRKKTPKFFSLHSFAEAGYPFVDNIRFFLQECAELETTKSKEFPSGLYFLSMKAGVSQLLCTPLKRLEIDFGD